MEGGHKHGSPRSAIARSKVEALESNSGYMSAIITSRLPRRDTVIALQVHPCSIPEAPEGSHTSIGCVRPKWNCW